MRSIAAFAVAALVAAAHADTIVVSPAGPITSIQAGVDAANPGDTVLVLAGTYSETVSVTKSAIEIRGVGSVQLNGTITFLGAKRCTFRGFTVNGTGIAVLLEDDCHGNALSDLDVTTTGVGSIGICIGGVKNTARLCNVGSSGGRGFLLLGASHVLTSCTTGIGGATAEQGYHVTGDRMTLSGCVSANASFDAFWVSGSGCVLSRCTATEASFSGFRLTGNGNTLSGCVADGGGDHAVNLQSNGNLVTGCRIGLVSGNDGAGIQLYGGSGNVVSACSISGAGGSGIEVGPYGNARLNRLERNRVFGNDFYGIYLSNAFDASDNWLEANVVTGNGQPGIRVDSDDNVIVRNKVSANAGGSAAEQIVGSGKGNFLSGNKPDDIL